MPSTRYQEVNAHHYYHIQIVGDIRGEHQLLRSRLHQPPSFPETDSLISVGDNTDRGSKSLDVLCLLNQSWFISVKNNHEAMALDAFATGDGNMRLASGGDWFFDLSDSGQQEAIDLLLKSHHLPYIIETTSDIIKYVIAYADYLGGEYLFGKETAESELFWSVDRVQKSFNGELQ